MVPQSVVSANGAGMTGVVVVIASVSLTPVGEYVAAATTAEADDVVVIDDDEKDGMVLRGVAQSHGG